MKKFNELGYSLPSETPDVYAGRAVTVLNDLLETDASTAPYALQPSAVLALAGLRTFSPFHQFTPETSPAAQRKFGRTLGKYGVSLYVNEADERFSLYTKAGVEDIKNRYELVVDSWTTPNGYDANTVHEWLDINRQSIIDDFKEGSLPTKWQKDLDFTTQYMEFGMMLGYPGVAISSGLWAAAKGDITGEKLPWVMIAKHNTYYGTDVSYQVDPSVIKSEEITSHKKLWKKTLKIVYDTLPNDELMQNKKFSGTIKQLKKL